MSLSAQNSSSAELTESELVVLAQAGDHTAVEVLFKRYYARVCLYLIRMVGNDGVGCELAQEVFLKAWQALPRLQNTSSFASWLYRIATYTAHDYLRHVQLVQVLPWGRYKDIEKNSRMQIAGPERQVEEAELLTLALKHVPISYRGCVILQIVEELPQRQIAEILGIKESSVSTYVSRGLRKLRQAYLLLSGDQDRIREEKKAL